MNLFSKEMRRNAFSLMLWMIVITLLISVTMSVYRTFVENQSKVMGMMSLVPKGALQFKGISNFNDLLSVLGFYAANNVIYMMVLGSIFAIVLSSNILLKEEYDKTAEYLLTRPLSRSEIFLSKLAVLSIHVLLLNLVTSLAGFICMELVKNGPFSFKAFLILSLYTLLLNILFGAIGLFLSTLVKRPKPITTLSIGLVLVFYFVYTLSKITESTEAIGYLSPFKYVKMDAINPAYELDLWHLLYFVGISLLLVGLSYRLYARKDIYT
ncbi:MAG: ABC transporter permease subunit [Ignavibacteriales bacterium]|nr:ABC transporter permease subunit [Ignavibacteriales bacterium]